MPYSGVPNSKTAAVDRCVTKVMAQGKDKDEAIAICIAQVTKHRSVLVPLGDYLFNQILEPTMRAVGDSPFRFRAYGVLFNTVDTKDLYGTYFDAETRYYLDWYTTRPWLYHHGMHPQLRSEGLQKIGMWDTAGIDDRGVFLEGELDRRHKYLEELQILGDAGFLFPSSGTLNYAAKFGEDGHVLEWPITEVSSTVSPGNQFAEAAVPAVQRAFRTLAQFEKETGGIYTMTGFGDKVRDLLGRRSASEDEAGVEETEAEKAVRVAAEVAAADLAAAAALLAADTSSEEEDPESLLDPEDNDEEEVRTADLKPLIDAIRAIDANIETLMGELHDVQELVVRLGEADTARAVEVMTSPEWYRSLFSVRTKVDEHAEDEDAAATRKANENADASRTSATDTGGGIFGALQG